MKKILQSILYIALGSSVGMLVFYLFKIQSIKFIESEFLLSYLGIFLGFAFSVVTFVMTTVEKAREHVTKSESYTVDEKKQTKERISKLNDELSDNLIFLFTSFLVVVVLMFWEVIDIPNITFPAELWYSKLNLLKSIKLSIFGWSVYSIYDLLVAAFQVNTRVEKILEVK